MGLASDRPGWLRAEAATWEGAVGTTVERGWEKKSPTTTDEAGNGREEMRATAVDP